MPLTTGMVMEISYGYLLPRPCRLLLLQTQEALQSCHSHGVRLLEVPQNLSPREIRLIGSARRCAVGDAG